MCEGEATWGVRSAYRTRRWDRAMGEADLNTVRVEAGEGVG